MAGERKSLFRSRKGAKHKRAPRAQRATLGQLYAAREALEAAYEALAAKTEQLQTTLDNITQGVVMMGPGNKSLFTSRRAAELLDLPAHLRDKSATEITRFQIERGDFGENLELVDDEVRSVLQSIRQGGEGAPLPPRYIRTTLSGSMIEIRTTLLPAGGWVRTYTDVTQYVQVLAALRESEARFRNLVELSSDWYWEQDADFCFVSTEGRHTGRGGISAEDHVGKRRWELPGTEIVGQSWEEHRTQLAQRRVFRDLLLKRTSHAGQIHYVSVAGEPIFDANGTFRGYRGLARDITESKRVENELRANRKLFEQVIDAIPMSIFAKDLESRYVMVNGYMAEFFGTTKAALLQHHTSELPSREATRRQSLRDDQWVYGNRKALVHETWIEKPDGTPVPYHSSKIPLFDDSGALTGLLGINRDTTEQMRAQEKLREMNASLEERVRERTADLEATLKELEAFSYSVSHDLRSPLGIISGFTHMVAKDESDRLSDEGRRKLGVVESNANKMSMLVDDLLALSRLSRAVLAEQEVDLRALAKSAAEELRLHYPRASLEIGKLPAAGGDPTLLRQALLNLIGNALKYSSKVEAPRVEVGWTAADAAWFVRDNGAGFDMRYSDKLFGTFERLHSDAEFPGTGVGLAIVKRIVERHGGRVWATGEPGNGATFYFTLRPKRNS